MTLRAGVLGRRQSSVLRRLGPFLETSPFYLAGGTALALQLGHRRSIDFDWFTEDAIADPFRLAADIAGHDAPIEISGVEKGTLYATLSGVRLSFIEYRYPLLRAGIETERTGLRLASLEDIAAMKLAAVAQRGSRKDFVDIAALGRLFTLDEMLEHYRRKYRVRDTGHVLVALSYFDDADREPMPTMLQRLSWAQVKRTIRTFVRNATAD